MPRQIDRADLPGDSTSADFDAAHPLALFRRTRGGQMSQLAEEHIKHDLNEEDRQTLMKAAKSFSTHAMVGSAVGLGLGLFLAFRVRSARRKVFNAVRVQEKPTALVFEGGRTEPLPDLTPMLKPSLLGDFAAYFFFGMGGLFIGGETGLLTGSISGGRTITQDPATRERIDTAFRRFRADALRQEADRLDGGKGLLSTITGN